MRRSTASKFTIAVTLLSASCLASAQAWSAGQIVKFYELSDEGRMVAGAYLKGFVDHEQLLKLLSSPDGSRLAAKDASCTPRSSTGDDLARVFVGFVAANPVRAGEVAFLVAIDAFKTAWPCKPEVSSSTWGLIYELTPK